MCNGTCEGISRVAVKLIAASGLSLCSRRMAYLACAKRKIPWRGPIAWRAKPSFHQDGPMSKFVLIQEGIGRRPWDLCVLILIQTRFPMTGRKSETMKKGENDKRRQESHFGGRQTPLAPRTCSPFLKASWSWRAPIRNPRPAISKKYNSNQFI